MAVDLVYMRLAQKGMTTVNWEDDGDGNVALLPENDEEATVLAMMANAYDHRNDDQPVTVRIILKGEVGGTSLPRIFDGMIFGVDEYGVTGINLSWRKQRGFYVDWVAMDMTAMIESRMRACVKGEGA